MSKFEYPRLSRTVIITILKESQIVELKENDLKNPNPDFVSDLYTRLLIYLDTLHEDEQGQVEFSALEQLENPDLHVGSVQVMNLYSRIKGVVASLDCPMQFNLKDLIRPDAARTEFFIGTILNFCLHKDAKMNILRPIVEELADPDEQRNDWEAKISQLIAVIAAYNEAREKELPLVQEVDTKVKELQQTIAGLNGRQMLLKASYNKLKDKTKEMEKKVRMLIVSVFQMLKDKLQRALEEKKAAMEEAKNAERYSIQSFQEKTALLEVYTKAFKKMEKHFKLMEDIQKQVDYAKSVEKDYKGLKAKLSDDAVLDKLLEAKFVELQGKVGQYEIRSQLAKERDLKFSESTWEFNNVKLEVESRRHNLEARQKKVEDVVAEVDAITSKTNMVKESGAAKVQELVGRCEEIAKLLKINETVQSFQQYRSSIWELLPIIGPEKDLIR
ncbi:hypothetical protein SLA2020_343140 [Shorea laevis]